MAQFQTWFGNAPYLAYGIQLLPLTAISEARDGIEWAKAMYPDFSASCEENDSCTLSGWSVQQLAILATVGHSKDAAERAQQLPRKAFDDPGGNGHSLTNTLWYIATRPMPEAPQGGQENPSQNKTVPASSSLTDCGRPEICTAYVLDTIAGLYSCRQRIKYLMTFQNLSEKDACAQVAGVQFPRECGLCNPNSESKEATDEEPKCPPCTSMECESDLNRCPIYDQTFVCTQGASLGGCAPSPWDFSNSQCGKCCELTNCPKRIDPAEMKPVDVSTDTDNCPPCSKKTCRSRLNLCPVYETAPFLCTDGPSKGGCSPRPWSFSSGDCIECCQVLPGCSH